MMTLHQAIMMSYAASQTPPQPSNSMSFITSTLSKYDVNTQIADVIPTVQNGDGLFAFVMTRSNLTIPSGWTEITHVDCKNTAVEMQRLTLLKKDVVSATDSGQGVTVAQSTSGRIALNMVAFRSSTAVFEVGSFSSNNLDKYNGFDITPPTLTALTDKEIFFIGGTTVLADNDNSTTPNTLSGFTLSSGTVVANRLNSQYKIADINYSNSGSFNMVPSSSASENGLASIVIRIKAI